MDDDLRAPACPAMLLCDQVYRDSHSGKFSALGIFDTVRARALPYEHPGLTVFVVLTGGRGESPLRLSIVSPEGESIAEVPGTLRFGNPRAVAYASIPFGPIAFARAGLHLVQLVVGTTPVAERPLRVVLTVRT